MLLNWTPIYSVNVKELDDQHKVIFDVVNKVHSIPEKKLNKDEAMKIIEDLIKYGNIHLATEEKYFEEFNYPDAKLHISEHRKYIKQMLDFKEEIEVLANDDLYDKVSMFLRDWWINHIQHVDQNYSVFFNQHGLY